MDVAPQELSVWPGLLGAAAVFVFGLWLNWSWLWPSEPTEEEMIAEEMRDKVERRLRARQGRPRDWRAR